MSRAVGRGRALGAAARRVIVAVLTGGQWDFSNANQSAHLFTVGF